LVDINPDTLSLDLIGAPVKAFGGASALIEGEIQALLYRYSALGGFDYVTDFLSDRGRRLLDLAFLRWQRSGRWRSL
jgi:hypothetical protein